MPSGPTPRDCVANAALFFGLLWELLETVAQPEQRLPFSDARDNFYRAARDGMAAELRWFDGTCGTARELCLQQLLPMARRGLERLGLDPAEAQHWLQPVLGRLQAGRTGASWQRDWIRCHGEDFGELVLAYHALQQDGQPVHCWDTPC